MKGTVYRITGSIPASNFIQFPHTSTQSLGLTGRYLYCLFRPIAGKYFVVHVDVATDEGLTIRISFSNMFKEFKSTSTWLQFPFVSSPPPGSVDEVTLGEAGTITSKDCVYYQLLWVSRHPFGFLYSCLENSWHLIWEKGKRNSIQNCQTGSRK